MSSITPPPPGRPETSGAAQRLLLRTLFDEAVAAVGAARVMPRAFARPNGGRLAVIAAGKGAGAMMEVLLERVDGPVEGLVVTPEGHEAQGPPLPVGVELILAGHPVPNLQSAVAATRALSLAQSLGKTDRLVVLLSGGGSALLAAPATGISLQDKIDISRALLRSGAAISEINVVRRRLSRIKGGGLAAAASPAPVTTLLISDIPGDDVALIASGPTIESGDAQDAARRVVERYGLVVSPEVLSVLSRPSEDPKHSPGGQREVHLLASARTALDAARRLAADEGFVVEDLGDSLEGSARDLGASHALLALQRQSLGASRVLLSGGETSVVVANPDGRGGRNLEYLLALVIGLDGAPGVFALACDTDGVDGTDRAAGALAGPDTLARAKALGIDPRAYLDANNAFLFFEALEDLVVTGPTRTNVNDFRAILIMPQAASPLRPTANPP